MTTLVMSKPENNQLPGYISQNSSAVPCATKFER